jgi:hypothetical protein
VFHPNIFKADLLSKCIEFNFFFSKPYADPDTAKIAKQAFKLAPWIVVSQLKTVFKNDKSNALCKIRQHKSLQFKSPGFFINDIYNNICLIPLKIDQSRLFTKQ